MTTQIATQTILTQYDDSPLNLPKGVPFVAGQTNRALLQAVQRAAGCKIPFPTETKIVFQLLNLMGYDVSRSSLEWAVKTGKLKVEKSGNQYRWNSNDVIEFADLMERQRRWLPLHPAQSHKLTDQERIEHTALVAYRKTILESFMEFSENDLINHLVDHDDRDTRSQLAFCLKTKLGFQNVRGTEGNSVPQLHQTN